MLLPDYTAALNAIAAWIGAADGATLKLDENLFSERHMPDEGDLCGTVFEAGGTFDRSRNLLTLRIEIEVRAAGVAESRAQIRGAVNAALNGWKTAARSARCGLTDLTLGGVPENRGRDEFGRNYMAAQLTATVATQYNPGAPL